MSKIRVDCIECKHLLAPVYENPTNWLSKMILRERCALGFRVMYRKPKNQFECGGYFRNCSSFSSTEP